MYTKHGTTNVLNAKEEKYKKLWKGLLRFIGAHEKNKERVKFSSVILIANAQFTEEWKFRWTSYTKCYERSYKTFILVWLMVIQTQKSNKTSL